MDPVALARIYKERCLKEQRREDDSVRVYRSQPARDTIPIKINNSDPKSVSAFLHAGRKIVETSSAEPAAAVAKDPSTPSEPNFMYARSSQVYGKLAGEQTKVNKYMLKYRKPKGSSAETAYADGYHRMSGKSPYAR